MSAWILFYKGTSLQFPYAQRDNYIALWESTIDKGLQCGVSLEQQQKDCKEDLDEMENWIVDMFGNEEYDNDIIEKKIGKKDFLKLLNKWGLNVVCGLKLGVINNDEMNGHQFIHQSPHRKSADKQKVNDPCACGSGKKYKKCCHSL